MRLNHLVLRNFRNYVDCEIDFPNRSNLIIGGNAQGKTSLLEAIYFLSTAKSHRTYPDDELIRHNENWFYLKGVIAFDFDTRSLSRSVDRGDSPQALATPSRDINGQDASAAPQSSIHRSDFDSFQPAMQLRESPQVPLNSNPSGSGSHYAMTGWSEAQIPIHRSDFASLNSMTLEVSNESNGKKRFKLNGDLQRKLSQWIGQFTVVFFSPESLTLVKGAPADRRRFIDLFISQVSPAYLSHLQNYQFALKQRNELLKQIRAKQAGVDLLDPWDTLLIDNGIFIIQTRKGTLIQLAAYAQEKHAELTGGSEKLALKYQLPHALEGIDSVSESDVEDKFRNALASSRPYDILRGTTSVGPHRDDLKLILETVQAGSIQRQEAKSFCSQGQQRTIALSLKLGELELIRELTQKTPIVLLDDVISELDEMRATFLFDLLLRLDAQTFITSTRRDVWTGELGDCCVLTVENGQIIRRHP